MANRVISEGEVILSDEIGKDPRYSAKHARRSQLVDVEGVKSLLAVPLISGKQAIGGILLYRREVDPFSEDDLTLVKSFAAQAVIAIENVRQFRKLESRLEREAATAKILQVISQSRDDEQPVFDEILKNASRLCDAPLAVLGLITEDRQQFYIAAHRGTKSEFVDDLNKNPPNLDPERYAAARSMVEMRTIHVDDLADPNLYGAGDDFRDKVVKQEGIRSAFVVPLILGDQSIGAIFLYRREVSPFSEEDMALVEAFAAQAVIAIENVRQFRELQQRLQREAASREILQIISRNRADANPVFKVILGNAARLCAAPHAILLMRNAEDTHLELVASNTAQSAFVDSIREAPHALDSKNSIAVHALLELNTEHVPDIRLDARMQNPAPQLQIASDVEGMRSVLIVPLIQEDRAVGVICLYRLEVLEFSEDEIELVRSFAAQAVIAIENSQQLEALQSRTQEVQALNESLEQRVEDQVGEIERMGKLKRFLPAAVADTVVSQGSDKMLSSHRALLGVLFCDIRGFTAFCGNGRAGRDD